MQVERYHFFGNSVRSWHREAESHAEAGTDEDAEGGCLATCLRVLKEVHADFFEYDLSESDKEEGGGRVGAGDGEKGEGGVGASTAAAAGGEGGGREGDRGGRQMRLDPGPLLQRDVRGCLTEVRSSVLRGCCLAFSR